MNLVLFVKWIKWDKFSCRVVFIFALNGLRLSITFKQA